MERKIGEIFEFGGEWYQCVKGIGCNNCDLRYYDYGQYCMFKDIVALQGCCSKLTREDKQAVIFKRLEKVGEPFTGKVHIQLQRYKIYTEPIINPTENVGYINEENTIVIEIKQNKESMEDNKLNLKSFNLQKAREGKPVCTRDGRKARIICFDKEDIRPIVALIKSDKGGESAYYYYTNGMTLSDNYQSVHDLMMLPEKKVGYVNLYHNCNDKYAAYLGNNVIYKDRAFAENIAKGCLNYIKTVKVEWEE